MLLSVRNRLQELEKSSLEIVRRSAHSLQHLTLRILSPPAKVLEARPSQSSARSTTTAEAAPQIHDVSSSGSTSEAPPGPRRRIPRPVTIRQPKLIGKSVEGAAMQAVAASRKRASTNPFKNVSSVTSTRRLPSVVSKKEGSKTAGSRLVVEESDGGPRGFGRPPTGSRRLKEKESDDETSRIKVDFRLVHQQKSWRARRSSGLQRASTIVVANLCWPRVHTQVISLSLAEFVIAKSPMTWCDACRLPPLPLGLSRSFAPLFARWILAVAPNINVLHTTATGIRATREDESILMASTIKNVRGIKGLVVVKISKIVDRRAGVIVRCQGWIMRLPRRTRRDHLKKSDANVTGTSFTEKDATGLDKLTSDVHVRQ